ncbi:MAG: undecaprenyldiphospho-muramoylpentapeptide beta-N-acetylglucosaminyltransferase [Proteobacteria bacterium]|nr:undecaprenyldiphospho-muramoylpentapeptide beta-N-acetylglucosaminyltransferase [Pseudomonadota bacterium]
MSSINQIKVLIAGGGTGGHLFPGIAIIESLKSLRDCEVRFVGTRRGIEKKVVPEQGYHLYTLPVRGLYRVGVFKKILSISLLPLAFLKALSILIVYRPHLVIGVGGYASGPLLALSTLLRFRTALQEQNAYPGFTNRLLGKFVPISFVPFSGMDHLFKNAIVVGNPIRKSITKILFDKTSPAPDKITLTIIGGSQGARVLNKTMVELLPHLQAFDRNVRIIHQTGVHDFDWVDYEYSKFPQLKTRVKPFFNNMPEIYQETSLLFCRSGSIVNEIIAVGKASILVPIAVSSGNHQLENAKKMASVGASILIEEQDLDINHLMDKISELINNPDLLRKMESRAFSLYSGDSAKSIAQKLFSFYRL